MIDLKDKLKDIVKPKQIARIEKALQSHVSPKINVDTHIATSIVKGLLIRKRRVHNLLSKREYTLCPGYAALYREKRKGQEFVGGRQIKFYAVSWKRASKVASRANAVFEALGINARAVPDAGWEYGPVSMLVLKDDPEQESSNSLDLLEILSK